MHTFQTLHLQKLALRLQNFAFAKLCICKSLVLQNFAFAKLCACKSLLLQNFAFAKVCSCKTLQNYFQLFKCKQFFFSGQLMGFKEKKIEFFWKHACEQMTWVKQKLYMVNATETMTESNAFYARQTTSCLFAQKLLKTQERNDSVLKNIVLKAIWEKCPNCLNYANFTKL